MSDLVNFKSSELKPTKLGMFIFAILSKASYSRTPGDVLKTFGLLNQFEILKQYRNIDSLTVKDKSSNQVIIAIRGTDDKNKTGNRIRDLVSDYGIVTGQDDRVYRKAEVEVIVKKLLSALQKKM